MKILGEILTPSCKWTDWLALDISADMAYSREMKQMQTSKRILFVESFVTSTSVLTKCSEKCAPS